MCRDGLERKEKTLNLPCPDADVVFVCGKLPVAVGALARLSALPRAGDLVRFNREYVVDHITWSYERSYAENPFPGRVRVCLRMMENSSRNQALDREMGRNRGSRTEER